MKKETVLNILRIMFITVVVVMAAAVFVSPPKTETNILRAILSNSETDELIVDLSQKHSGRLGVIFESDEPENITETKNAFLEKISDSNFEADIANTKNFKQILNTYKDYYRNLLSPKTRYELSRDDVEAVKLEGLERVYNPLSVNILPLEKDPFFFFIDYLQSLSDGDNTGIQERDGKFYEILTLNFKDEIALSPTLLNEQMKTVVGAKHQLEKKQKDTKIYLAGPPVHTYFASSKSMLEINVICVLSSIFIILLCKLYFKSFKILIPIALSLSWGFLSGYIVTALVFRTIHILTFVFSTTLIGICIDYSLHYFAHNNDIKRIFKSLTASMITTVCSFLILLFSDIELLRQIAVYTATGLFSVYLFVVLFYPVLCEKLGCDSLRTSDVSKLFSLSLSKRQKRIFVLIILFLSIIGLFRLKFNDDVRNMYKPAKDLLASEKLYSSLSGGTQNTKFIITKAPDIQSLLEKEEFLTGEIRQQDYIALSKFVPSVNQQKQNLRLRRILYKKELNNYASFLPEKFRQKLLTDNAPAEFLMPERIPEQIRENFLVNDNQSIIILKQTNKKLEDKIKNTPGAMLIDLQKDISDRVKACRINCLRLIVPVVAFLFFAMSFVFGAKNTAKIILPSLLGGLFTLSLLGLFQVDVNLFHVLSLFLITGFSLDYSIFRFNDARTENMYHSRVAVLMSCATTVFSFLLLSLTSFKLVSSLGFMLACGLISSYILSLILINPKQET